MLKNIASRAFFLYSVVKMISAFGSKIPYFEAVFRPCAHGTAHGQATYLREIMHTKNVYTIPSNTANTSQIHSFYVFLHCVPANACAHENPEMISLVHSDGVRAKHITESYHMVRE